MPARWTPSVVLAAAGLLLVLYAALCKGLLFHGLEYFHTDFISFIEMSRSLYESGELTRRKAARTEDRLGVLKEAARSQLSYLKLAVFGGSKKSE